MEQIENYHLVPPLGGQELLVASANPEEHQMNVVEVTEEQVARHDSTFKREMRLMKIFHDDEDLDDEIMSENDSIVNTLSIADNSVDLNGSFEKRLAGTFGF